MQRIGRVSKLKPGATAAYERLHAEVWTEVLTAITKAGISNYTIFRDSDWLFSYFELSDGAAPEAVGEMLSRVPECRRWEDCMRELRDPDVAADWLPMKEVFHLP